uniref:Uncharacterized protein n=1 Tax=Ditylenchus dipsaci TaxID=166011 RepID=A0A915DF13_9BILA
MPTIAFDLQYVGVPIQRIFRCMMEKQFNHAKNANLSLPRSFPLEFINADLSNQRIIDFLNYTSNTPNYLRTGSPSDSSRGQSVPICSGNDGWAFDCWNLHIPCDRRCLRETAYVSKTGNFHVMRLPIDKYLLWKCGHKVVPLNNMLSIFLMLLREIHGRSQCSRTSLLAISRMSRRNHLRCKKWNERKDQMRKISHMVYEAANGGEEGSMARNMSDELESSR